MNKKRIFIIAGPNGSGKTTTALSLFPNLLSLYEFLNADEIARGLAPLHPESVSLTASKFMIQRLLDLLQNNKSFAFETTASGTNYVKHLLEARTKGYEIHLLYLWLSSANLAVERVQHRVRQGGHSIPEATIRRRYKSGLKNILLHYLPLAHSALFLDNSIAGASKVVAEKSISGKLIIENKKIWKEIERIGHER